MAKQRRESEAAAREAQQALRALAEAVHSGAKDGDFPKKLRKALREVEPLIERADRKLGKRQAKLVKAARKEREKRAAAQAKAAAKTKPAEKATAKPAEKAKPKPAEKAKATAKPKAAAKASAPTTRRQGPGTTPRTSVAGARTRKRARR